MKQEICVRVEEAAKFILENGATIRRCAGHFGVSKTTIHKDVSERLRKIDHATYLRVKSVLETNKAERHIRGGMATRKKYRGEET